LARLGEGRSAEPTPTPTPVPPATTPAATPKPGATPTPEPTPIMTSVSKNIYVRTGAGQYFVIDKEVFSGVKAGIDGLIGSVKKE